MRMMGLATVGAPVLAGRGMMTSGAPVERGIYASPAAVERRVYVGTYTSAGSRGVYLVRMNMTTGELVTAEPVAETTNPSYLAYSAYSPNSANSAPPATGGAGARRSFLYAVNEVNSINGEAGGGVTAFAVDGSTGGLRQLNQVGTRGGSPCYVTVEPDGRYVLAANYGGGNLVVLPIRPDGSLGLPTDVEQHTGTGANPQRQPGPRAHCVLFTPDRRHVVAVDLGIDKVMIYRWDGGAGRLEPAPTPFFATRPGAGPRHLAFHPQGRLACLINELDSTLVACSWDARRGEFKEIQTVSTLPAGFKGTNYCADVHFHPNGRFVYGSNRGHDTIAIWRIDARTGRLELVGHEPTGGRNPRNFAIDPTGRWLLAANQTSDSIIVFRIDQRTGRLTRTGEPLGISMPVCLTFV